MRRAIALCLLLVACHRRLPSDLARGGLHRIYDLDLQRVAAEAFARDLNASVKSLRARGVTVAQVSPHPRSATLLVAVGSTVPSDLPFPRGLTVDTHAPGQITLSLSDERAHQIQTEALTDAALAMRDQIRSVRRCEPKVQVIHDRIVLDLPQACASVIGTIDRLLTSVPGPLHLSSQEIVAPKR